MTGVAAVEVLVYAIKLVKIVPTGGFRHKIFTGLCLTASVM